MSEGEVVREMAHLRPMPRCRRCGKAASEELYTGRNDLVGRYCGRCAKAALRDFKAGRPLT